MRRRRSRPSGIDIRGILDRSIGELLGVNYDLLRYRVRAYVRALRVEERLLESRLREVSGEAGMPFSKDYVDDLNRRLEGIRRDLEVFGRIDNKIGILATIKMIEKELKDVSRELWNEVERMRLRDILDFDGDPGDKLAVYNYLLGIFKEPRAGAVDARRATPPAGEPAGSEQPTRPEPGVPSSVKVSEKEYVSMSVEGWVELLKECFEGGKLIELPDNYLAESMRRPLRNLIAAMLELPPERLRYVIPKKYKYLLVLHGILYAILRENERYAVTPGSSDREYIEGEGGIFGIFQADPVGEEATDSVRRRTYRLTVGGREYRIVKEVVLENGRAKQIRYMSGG